MRNTAADPRDALVRRLRARGAGIPHKIYGPSRAQLALFVIVMFGLSNANVEERDDLRRKIYDGRENRHLYPLPGVITN